MRPRRLSGCGDDKRQEVMRKKDTKGWKNLRAAWLFCEHVGVYHGGEQSNLNMSCSFLLNPVRALGFNISNARLKILQLSAGNCVGVRRVE